MGSQLTRKVVYCAGGGRLDVARHKCAGYPKISGPAKQVLSFFWGAYEEQRWESLGQYFIVQCAVSNQIVRIWEIMGAARASQEGLWRLEGYLGIATLIKENNALGTTRPGITIMGRSGREGLCTQQE